MYLRTASMRTTKKITNVADGNIAANSKDAVTAVNYMTLKLSSTKKIGDTKNRTQQ